MNLLVLTTSYPANSDDYSGIFIKNFLNSLPNEVAKITVCTPHKIGSLTTETNNRITIKRFRYWLPSSKEVLLKPGGLLTNLKKSALAKLQLFVFVPASIIQACRYAKGNNIIHAHWILYGIAARIVNLFFNIPYIITVHGTDIEMMKNFTILRNIGKIIFKHASHVICVSTYLEGEVKKITPSATTHVFPNGVGNSKKLLSIQRSNDFTPPHLLWVGRFSREKNIPFLLKMVHTIKNDLPAIHLTLVGSGPEEKTIQRLICEMGLQQNIRMIGPVSPNNINTYYEKANIFILPSLREGFGVVIIEAMAAGLPVIASSVGGIVDIIQDKKSGYLCDLKNIQTFIYAVSMLSNNSNLRLRMGQTGRAIVQKKYLWEIISPLIYQSTYLKTHG